MAGCKDVFCPSGCNADMFSTPPPHPPTPAPTFSSCASRLMHSKAIALVNVLGNGVNEQRIANERINPNPSNIHPFFLIFQRSSFVRKQMLSISCYVPYKLVVDVVVVLSFFQEGQGSSFPPFPFFTLKKLCSKADGYINHGGVKNRKRARTSSDAPGRLKSVRDRCGAIHLSQLLIYWSQFSALPIEETK